MSTRLPGLMSRSAAPGVCAGSARCVSEAQNTTVITTPTTPAMTSAATSLTATISPPRMAPVYTRARMLAAGATQRMMNAGPIAPPP